MEVNTRLMADKAHADALEARAEQLLAEFVPQADRSIRLYQMSEGRRKWLRS